MLYIRGGHVGRMAQRALPSDLTDQWHTGSYCIRCQTHIAGQRSVANQYVQPIEMIVRKVSLS